MSIPIRYFIPVGKEKAISKQALMNVLQVSEREVRQMIERDRNEGVPIISSSRGKGYYIADSANDVQVITRDLRSRAFKMIKTAKAIEESYKN